MDQDTTPSLRSALIEITRALADQTQVNSALIDALLQTGSASPELVEAARRALANGNGMVESVKNLAGIVRDLPNE